MKLCRYDDNRIGLVRGRHVHDATAILDTLPPLRYPAPFGDHLIANLQSLRGRLEELADQAPPRPIEEVRFLSPVANPSKIIGTPANYHAHVEEARRDAEIAVYSAGKQRTIEEQGLFLKASSSLVGPSEGVAIRFPDRRTDHEAELGVVIGRKTGFVAEADALGVVAGYAIALDMVVRGKEDRSFRKSPDSYAVLGPWLVTADELGDPGALDFSLRVNGELRQAANTREMIINMPRQISWASSVYTLHPGDIIMSGTCQGVSPVQPGDVMTIVFERIGEMSVPVRAHGT
jgi:2-keto-4-pentenoate hydratase/2-oxohepta-3-ene-1,7-dioic acid hydratase in catechol pathway